MTGEQIIKVLDKYLAFYTDEDGVGYESFRFPDDAKGPTDQGAIRHVLWMCREAKSFAMENPEKAMRWLCFVQGVLWSVEGWTIEEFQHDNRGT